MKLLIDSLSLNLKALLKAKYLFITSCYNIKVGLFIFSKLK